jgi:sulfoxide reductase heme-binding subunit YedZ
MIDPGDHLFWITSRAAGVTALLLASIGVSAGLMMGTRLVRGTRAGDLRAFHEVISLGTIIAIVVHGASLLGDSYINASLADILIPLHFGYRTVWTTLGIGAGWGLTLLGVSYYARKHIGQARWRTAHRFTALAWILGIVHALGEGTDAGTTWFLGMIVVAVGPALLLLIARLAGLRRRTASPRPRPSVPAATVR